MFSLKARFEIEYIITSNKTNGIAVITEALLLINKMYKITNKAERIKTALRNTLIIDNECFNKLEKFI